MHDFPPFKRFSIFSSYEKENFMFNWAFTGKCNGINEVRGFIRDWHGFTRDITWLTRDLFNITRDLSEVTRDNKTKTRYNHFKPIKPL